MRQLPLAILLSLSVSACSDAPVESSPEWIADVTPFPSLLRVGESVQLTPIAIDRDGLLYAGVTEANLRVSNEAVLRLEGGRLHAISMGRAIVTVTGRYNGRAIRGERPVVVQPRPAPAPAP